jgi:hypothetical protein
MDDTSCGRVAILTSGGDAPGINAAVRAATMALSSQGLDVLGVYRCLPASSASQYRIPQPNNPESFESPDC